MAIGAVATLVIIRMADWLRSESAPTDGTLRAALVDQLILISGDHCRVVCRRIAMGPRAEQLVLQRALNEVLAERGEGVSPPVGDH